MKKLLIGFVLILTLVPALTTVINAPEATILAEDEDMGPFTKGHEVILIVEEEDMGPFTGSSCNVLT